MGIAQKGSEWIAKNPRLAAAVSGMAGLGAGALHGDIRARRKHQEGLVKGLNAGAKIQRETPERDLAAYGVGRKHVLLRSVPRPAAAAAGAPAAKVAFWSGFEKRAYNYDYESKELKNYNEARSTATPVSKLKAGLIGAGAGGVWGTLMGALGKDNSAGSIALKGLVGAAIGGGAGVFAAIADKLGIEQAKYIMSMKPNEQKEYLRHLARKSEISDREYREWSRHYDMMGAMRRSR